MCAAGGLPGDPRGYRVTPWAIGQPTGLPLALPVPVGGVRSSPRACPKLKDDAGGGFLMAELVGKGVLCPL